MSVIFLLIPLSMIVAGCFLVAFIWAVRSGQYDDTCTPSLRVLLDEAGNPLPSSSPPLSPAGRPDRAATAAASAPAKASTGRQGESSGMVRTTTING